MNEGGRTMRRRDRLVGGDPNSSVTGERNMGGGGGEGDTKKEQGGVVKKGGIGEGN